jgi:hypothetical protein
MSQQRATTGNKGYSARDLMVMIGDTLFLAPTPFCSRSREVDELYGHVIELLTHHPDANVVDLRTPAYWRRLRAKPGGDFALRTDAEGGPATDIPLTEELPLFDAVRKRMFKLKKRAHTWTFAKTGSGQKRRKH